MPTPTPVTDHKIDHTSTLDSGGAASVRRLRRIYGRLRRFSRRPCRRRSNRCWGPPMPPQDARKSCGSNRSTQVSPGFEQIWARSGLGADHFGTRPPKSTCARAAFALIRRLCCLEIVRPHACERRPRPRMHSRRTCARVAAVAPIAIERCQGQRVSRALHARLFLTHIDEPHPRNMQRAASRVVARTASGGPTKPGGPPSQP